MKKTTKRPTRTESKKSAKLSAEDLKQVGGGLLTEIGFPACDGGSKDAAKLT